jgi:hypothetical protein
MQSRQSERALGAACTIFHLCRLASCSRCFSSRIGTGRTRRRCRVMAGRSRGDCSDPISTQMAPQKVELDTTTPIIVSRSTPSPDAAEIPIPPTSKPALNALAQANLLHKQVAKRKPPARAKYRSPNSDGEFRFAVNPMPSAWPVGW